jgi:hypothetical protein
VLACGEPYAGPFEVPQVAWNLRTHTGRVGLKPRPPAVVFRTRPQPGQPLAPTVAGVRGARRAQPLAATSRWRIVGICRRGGAA